MKQRFFRLRYLAPLLLAALVASPASAILFYTFLPSNGAGKAFFSPPRQVNPADVAVPPGYCIEPVVAGLTYPTAVITDEHDRVYVLESGYSYGEDFAPPRLLRVEPGGLVAVVATGDDKAGPWTGMSYCRGAFYVSDGGEARGPAASSASAWTARSPRSWTGCPAWGTTTPTGPWSAPTATSTSASAPPPTPASSAPTTPTSAG